MDRLNGSGQESSQDARAALALPYVINPALVPRVWSGPSWGYLGFRNDSWINSVWLGTGWHLLCLPQRVWLEVLVFSWKDPVRIPIHILCFAALTLAFVMLGVMGWLVMLPYPREVTGNARILNQEEALEDRRTGGTAPVRATGYRL